MVWLAGLSLILGLWLVSNFYSLFRNYRKASKIGVPMRFLPWNSYHPIWMIMSVPLRPALERYLPASWYRTINLATYGFEFRTKEALFADDIDAFALVTAGPVELSIRDPELVAEVLKRNKEFPITDIGGVILNIFGPTIVTSNGENWARQRKIIAPTINEKISKSVFEESLSQARQMLSSYMDDSRGITNETMHGMKTIAVNVLGSAGFGVSQPWKKLESEKAEEGFKHTYMNATRAVVEHLVEAALMPTKLLTLPFCSSSWQAIGHAKIEFPVHTKILLERERQFQATSSEVRSNLMSNLVRLSDAGKKDDADGTTKTDDGPKEKLFLAEEEIVGNLFIFTSAGFDTTANTMSYALAMLSTRPELQDWLYEEISTVLADKDLDDLEYNEVFPRLPRCLALMYETLRLFPPLTHLARQTHENQSVTITTSTGKTCFIPGGTIIYLSTVALGLDPRTWGSDSHEFRPSRWLLDPDAKPGEKTIADLRSMPRGAFVPWGNGPRSCPGMKFSQVEFVTVFMSIFGSYSCEPIRAHETETDEQRMARVEAIVQDSQPQLTLQMTRNTDLKIKWTRR